MQVLLVMGVAGSGKTEAGRRLAEALGFTFVEGDDLHPPGNIARMSRGVALTDADRADWLAAIRARIEGLIDGGGGVVVACSALKRAYREELLGGIEAARIAYLRGGAGLIEERMRNRAGHFMPASLLRSQFETLEEPGPGEGAIVVDVGQAIEAVVGEVLGALRAEQGPGCE